VMSMPVQGTRSCPWWQGGRCGRRGRGPRASVTQGDQL